MGKIRHAWRLIAAAAAFVPLAVQAQKSDITFIQLSKDRYFRQTSLSKVSLLSTTELPYGFSLDVECANRAAALRVKPTISLPATSKFRSFYNATPALGFDSPDSATWSFGFSGGQSASNFDNWGTRTKAELDQAFPVGRYTLKAQGRTIALTLPRDAYPPYPLLKLTGGKWVAGKYYIDAGRSLTVSGGQYSAYGTHPNNYLYLEMEDFITGDELFDHVQVAKQFPGSPPHSVAKSYSHRIPANTLKSGAEYRIYSGYGRIVSQSTLDGTTPILVSFGAETVVTLVAKASP